MGYAVDPAGTTNFPPVDITDIYDDRGYKIDGYKRVFNETDGQTLAIHTDSYELRPYYESFKQLEDAIAESSLDQRGLMSKTEFSHNGGRCFRSYLFPHVQIAARSSDPISLQVLAFDSYDGTYSTSIAAGGYRYICLNGSYFGKTIHQLKVRHVRGAKLRFDNGLEKVIAAAETFTAMQPRLARWGEVDIDVPVFKSVLQGMPQITERLSDHFVSRYATEAEEMTLYGCWNVLTGWATRGEGTAQSRVDRDRRVAALIESRPWRQLEDA
jgi:hypothetical protein